MSDDASKVVVELCADFNWFVHVVIVMGYTVEFWIRGYMSTFWFAYIG